MNKFVLIYCLVFLAYSCAKKEIVREVVKMVESPTLDNSAQPFLFSGDKTLMSWIENENDSLFALKYAEYANEEWQTAKTVATGTNWFVNWADFPAIVENNGNMLSHFLQMSAEGTYTYDIKLKLSSSLDDSWEDDFILHNDGTKSEHGFVSMMPYQDTSFFVTWLDGRNTTGGHDHGGAGAMTLRAATVTSNGTIEEEVELDSRVCDCCQTSAAITSNGPIVVYRDRSDQEIRDIYITRKIDSTWSQPIAVFNDEWKIAGCPVNGPRADGVDNTLAIAWYTGAEEMPKVKLIFSRDGGETFNTPILIDEVQTIGRVDVALIDDNNALVSWVTSQDSKTIIKAVKVNFAGEKNEAIVVSELNPSRASGFPQMEIVNDEVLFAWTTIDNDRKKISTATISLTDF